MADRTANELMHGKAPAFYCVKCGAVVKLLNGKWEQTCNCDTRVKGISTRPPQIQGETT